MNKKLSLLQKAKKYQVITFTLSFLFLNQEIVFWVNYLQGRNLIFEKLSSNILLAVTALPLFYFLQWLVVTWVASKLPREKLKQKFLKHPIATIILFVSYITDLPYRLSGYWGGNIASIFEVIIYYAFISFLWWLLVCWISNKIFKKQRFKWRWYKKIINKTFKILPILYKVILGIIVALFLIIALLILVSLLGYKGADLEKFYGYDDEYNYRKDPGYGIVYFEKYSDRLPATIQDCENYGGKDIVPIDYEEVGDGQSTDRSFIVEEKSTNRQYECIFYGIKEKDLIIGSLVTQHTCCFDINQ